MSAVPACQNIHTGALRMRRRLWTEMEFAVDAALRKEREDLASYRARCADDAATIALFEETIADLEELRPLIQAAAIQTSGRCIDVAKLAAEDAL